MTNYERFKQALKKRQEESYALLMQEVKRFLFVFMKMGNH